MRNHLSRVSLSGPAGEFLLRFRWVAQLQINGSECTGFRWNLEWFRSFLSSLNDIETLPQIGWLR
jgi:hypothetical protein